MKLLTRLALCALTGLAGLSPAIAAPITYSEGTDLGDFSSPLALGNLGVGLNTIRGAVDCRSTSCSDRHDHFGVTLAAGDRIVSAELEFLTYTNTTERTGHNPIIYFDASGSLAGVLPDQPPNYVMSAGVFTSFTGSVSGAGDLGIRISISNPAVDFGNNDPFNWTAAAGYELRIQVDGATPPVTAVPEPASLALSLAGLAAALASPGLARRQRPAQTDHA